MINAPLLVEKRLQMIGDVADDPGRIDDIEEDAILEVFQARPGDAGNLNGPAKLEVTLHAVVRPSVTFSFSFSRLL